MYGIVVHFNRFFFSGGFYNLGYISCTTVADLYIVSIENFSQGVIIGEVFAYEI